MDQKITEDAKHFGENVFIYCNQHLRPHRTGWCTVGVNNKVKLDATDEAAAYAECEAKGYKIYKG